MARVTGLEPATSGVTGRHSNQLSYTRTFFKKSSRISRGNLLAGRPQSLGWRLSMGFAWRCQQVSRRKHDVFHLSTDASLFCRVSTKISKKHHEGSCGFLTIRIDHGHRRGGHDPTTRRAISSVGRALRLHRRCREFESLIAHHSIPLISLIPLAP
jgi:hypothetical protein